MFTYEKITKIVTYSRKREDLRYLNSNISFHETEHAKLHEMKMLYL